MPRIPLTAKFLIVLLAYVGPFACFALGFFADRHGPTFRDAMPHLIGFCVLWGFLLASGLILWAEFVREAKS